MKRVSYLGGGTLVRRDPRGIDPRWARGENAQEGEDAVKRAQARRRAKVLARIERMNRP
jgi:hypothetical protein